MNDCSASVDIVPTSITNTSPALILLISFPRYVLVEQIGHMKIKCCSIRWFVSGLNFEIYHFLTKQNELCMLSIEK